MVIKWNDRSKTFFYFSRWSMSVVDESRRMLAFRKTTQTQVDTHSLINYLSTDQQDASWISIVLWFEQKSLETSSMRRPSLKEMPSYKDEASRALNRREELQRLKERLSSGRAYMDWTLYMKDNQWTLDISDREILNADPASKPWLRRLSSRQDNLRPLVEDGTYTASPAVVFSANQPQSPNGSSLRLFLQNNTCTLRRGNFTTNIFFFFCRTRNLSRGTSSSEYSDKSFNSDNLYYEYWN